MNRVFFLKELRQHGGWFVLLGLFTWFVVLVTSLGFNIEGTGGGKFAGVGMGLWMLMPVASLIVSHLLVSTEYNQRTQLFLEGLPLPKWRMIVLKLIIALVLIVLYAAGCVMIGWLFSFGTEAVTPAFLGILLSSACSWAAFAMAFFFAVGFLGRYRTIVLVTIALALIFLGTSTPVPLGEFPPFAVMLRFGLEHDTWPVSDLKFTGVFVAALIAVSLVLGLAKEGSIASMLGERMSYREKLFIGGGATLTVLSILTVYDPPAAEPFDLPGAVVEEWDGVRVAISPEDEDGPVDLEVGIAARLARRLARERDWLGIPPEDFPRIFVVEKTDIDEVERIDWEKIPGENVVLMFAGYRQEEFSENRLLSWTLSQALRKNSLERVGQEDRWWIVCGLEGLWELEEADEEEIAERTRLAVTTVRKHGLTIGNVFGWSKYQDDAGWREADAVAWLGMRFLAESHGEETVQRLAKATVTHPVRRVDFRAVIWDYLNPVESAFEKVTGQPLREYVEDWRQYILSQESESNPQEDRP